MATDPNLREKLREERRRRRALMDAQNKSVRDYKIESKYSKADRIRADEMAMDYCDTLNDAIDASLDNSLRMCSEIEKQGADTCNKLHDQRGQIKRIHKNMHETDEILKDSERSIQNIQSWKKTIIVKLSLCCFVIFFLLFYVRCWMINVFRFCDRICSENQEIRLNIMEWIRMRH